MNNKSNDNENIFFLLEEKNNLPSNEVDIQKMMEEFNLELDNSDLDSFILENDITKQEELETLYYEQYTIKDLLKICSYYNIDKNIRTSKCKKQDIISTIIYFESLPENFDIVEKRNKMWLYITELLNDPKMKKFIIWN
jgi:hypothetical protein